MSACYHIVAVMRALASNSLKDNIALSYLDLATSCTSLCPSFKSSSFTRFSRHSFQVVRSCKKCLLRSYRRKELHPQLPRPPHLVCSGGELKCLMWGCIQGNVLVLGKVSCVGRFHGIETLSMRRKM